MLRWPARSTPISTAATIKLRPDRERWRQPIVQLEESLAGRLPPQQPADKPPRNTESVEAERSLDFPVGGLQPRHELTLAVATVVADRPVHRVKEPGIGWYENDKPTARLHALPHVLERLQVVLDMLENVEADDRVARGKLGQAGGITQVRLEHLDCGLVAEAPPDLRHERWQVLQGDDFATIG